MSGGEAGGGSAQLPMPQAERSAADVAKPSGTAQPLTFTNMARTGTARAARGGTPVRARRARAPAAGRPPMSAAGAGAAHRPARAAASSSGRTASLLPERFIPRITGIKANITVTEGVSDAPKE